MELRRFDEAAQSFSNAVEIEPNALAYRHLGLALMRLGQFPDAADTFRLALGIDLDDAITHIELGRALVEMSDHKDAAPSYRRALELAPGDAGIEAALAGTLLAIGALPEARRHLQNAPALQSENQAARQLELFMGLYDSGSDPLELAAASRRYAASLTAAATPVGVHFNTPDPERRLRVGLVSGDLCKHSVSRFLETVLAAVDAQKLELLCLCDIGNCRCGHRPIAAKRAQWRRAANFDDDELTAAIMADQIDILVDLSGYTSHSRLPVFARRPAPIAVEWLGYSATTGLEAIDYVLADRHVIPPGEENQFAETPWRLPDSYLCFSPPRSSVEVAPLPALANGYVTFGSFNNANKLSERTIACWARVLQAVPESRLLLKARGLPVRDRRRRSRIGSRPTG